ncbi:MAG: hypothetical protein PHZ25_03085 [Candidatus Pacebacteria bacterium]|nr:hypothetical protein [Candidatus Paceibacterota bacterium]
MKESVNNIKKGDFVVLDREPYEVIDREHIAMQQRRAVVKLKVRNLKNGKVKEESMLSQGEIEVPEDLEKKPAVFAYNKKDEFWFHEVGNPGVRFMLKEELIGDKKLFLKPKMEISLLFYGEEVISIKLPIKVEYEVVEAPPVIKGATASGGNKPAKIETGAMVAVPMFIETGSKIIVNTERGEYDSKA